MEMWQLLIGFSRLVKFPFGYCPIIARLSAGEDGIKYFNNQAYIKDNGMQNRLFLTQHRFIVTASLPLFIFYQLLIAYLSVV